MRILTKVGIGVGVLAVILWVISKIDFSALMTKSQAGVNAVCSVFCGFWPAFIGLTTVYVVVAIGFIFLLAKEPMKTFKNNNTPLWVGLVAFVITFVIYCFSPGPGILLPKNVITQEQKNSVWNVLSNIWSGKDAVPLVPSDPLSWARETRFYLKSAGLYLLFDVLYVWYAIHDEIEEIFEKHRNKRREKPAGDGKAPHKTGATGHSFPELLEAEVAGSIIWDIAKEAARFLLRKSA